MITNTFLETELRIKTIFFQPKFILDNTFSQILKCNLNLREIILWSHQLKCFNILQIILFLESRECVDVQHPPMSQKYWVWDKVLECPRKPSYGKVLHGRSSPWTNSVQWGPEKSNIIFLLVCEGPPSPSWVSRIIWMAHNINVMRFKFFRGQN